MEMLFRLVWEIEKSSGWETSKTPTQWPAIYRVGFRVELPLLFKYNDVILFSLEDSNPFFKTIYLYFNWKVIGLGIIEGPYSGALKFYVELYGPTTTTVKIHLFYLV